MADKEHLLGLTTAELTAFVAALGEPAYRARQVFAALHHRRLSIVIHAQSGAGFALSA